MPTDRGFVVISPVAEGYDIAVCGKPFDGALHGQFACHHGAAEFVVTASEPLAVKGSVQFSSQPVEVFVAEDDPRIFITDIVGGVS